MKLNQFKGNSIQEDGRWSRPQRSGLARDKMELLERNR